jgi:hypothetical protein
MTTSNPGTSSYSRVALLCQAPAFLANIRLVRAQTLFVGSVSDGR